MLVEGCIIIYDLVSLFKYCGVMVVRIIVDLGLSFYIIINDIS